MKNNFQGGCVGRGLYSLGGWGRRISAFKASLVYVAYSRAVKAVNTEKPCLKKQKQKASKTIVLKYKKTALSLKMFRPSMPEILVTE